MDNEKKELEELRKEVEELRKDIDFLSKLMCLTLPSRKQQR